MNFNPVRALTPAILMLVLSSAPCLSDQQDQRLHSLFNTLHSGSHDAQLAAEGKIWEIWFDSGDDAINALMSKGRKAAQLGQFEIAEKFYTQVVKQAPKYSEGWNRRASIRYYTGDYQGSLADIQQTIKLEPRHFGAIWGLGMIRGSQHRYTDAIAAFERLLEIKPSAVEAEARIEMLRMQWLKETV